MFRTSLGIRRSFSTSRWLMPELLSLIPALSLAWYWYGSKGAVVVAMAGLPLAYRLLRRDAVSRAAQDGTSSGLAPRDAMVNLLDRTFRHSEMSGKGFACIVIGLDEQARLSGNFGRAAEEKALDRIGDRIRGVLREPDRLSRIDVGRYAIALAPARRMDLETALQIAGRLESAIAEPFSVDATTVYCTASVGFCLSSRAPAETGASLLTAAEVALEDALRNGPSAIRGFTADIQGAARDRDTARSEIEAALENGEIVAYFQPQLSSDTGDVVGFEALARWQHPRHGVLCPAEFLPAIEETGLSARLGEIMLSQALTALRSWDRAGLNVPGASVNFSKTDLRNPNLVTKLKWELDRFDLVPGRLTVEILESVFAGTEDDVIVRNIAALSQAGIGIDLDDFGTGNASIAAIRRFAVDRIKIDRSYVTHVDSDATQQRMISAILSMTDRLGLKTVAEGVETIGEHAILAQLGCTHVQGYAIARPMPFHAVADWLTRHRAKLAKTPQLGRRTG